MKYLLILFLAISLTANGQIERFDYKQNYAACVITVGTFLYLEQNGQMMNPDTRAIVAFSGMGTAVLSTFIYRGIKKYANTRHRRCRVYW